MCKKCVIFSLSPKVQLLINDFLFFCDMFLTLLLTMWCDVREMQTLNVETEAFQQTGMNCLLQFPKYRCDRANTVIMKH